MKAGRRTFHETKASRLLARAGIGRWHGVRPIWSGIVYDPTNYHNAVLRYFQLQQQLVQLQKSYAKITTQFNFAMRMATFIRNMPARYRAMFSQWRNVTSLNTFGNTGSWINGINSGLFPNDQHRLPKSDNPTLRTTRTTSRAWMPPNSRACSLNTRPWNSQTARTRTRWPPSARSAATPQSIQDQIANLEQDSFSADPDLNTEVSVLNKINAAGVLTLRTVQDSNKLLASLLEQQTILAKQQRDATTNAINTDIGRQASISRQHVSTDRHPEQLTPELPDAVSVHRNYSPASKEPTPCTRLPAIHLSGYQQSAHSESRLLRRDGTKHVPLLRHNLGCLVRSEIGSLRCWRQTPSISTTSQACF